MVWERCSPSPFLDDDDDLPPLPPFLPDLCLRGLPTFRREARDCDGLKTAERSSDGDMELMMGLPAFLGLAALGLTVRG